MTTGTDAVAGAVTADIPVSSLSEDEVGTAGSPASNPLVDDDIAGADIAELTPAFAAASSIASRQKIIGPSCGFSSDANIAW